jgi:GR25 family glycosyltransferase involved in LPS biosynthesis
MPANAHTWVINLERRPDRLKTFRDAHRGTRWGDAERWPAVDGRQLDMSAELAKMLEPNDFFWKKSVAGCALSHIGLWKKLAAADTTTDYYIILEDDVRVKAADLPELPPDFDIVYLGGILPHNRPVIERATRGIDATVKWLRTGPTIHFCTYSYVLSRKGAQRLLDIVADRGGIYTSVDLIMTQNADVLDIYCFHPMIAGCSQDDDPEYVNSDFNTMLRVDKFDSDIWNQTERWTEAEWRQFVRTVPGWAKKLSFYELNPSVLHGIIRDNIVPIVIGRLPSELTGAVPIEECVKDEDGWRLIDILDKDVELRGRYMATLRSSIGLAPAPAPAAPAGKKYN